LAHYGAGAVYSIVSPTIYMTIYLATDHAGFQLKERVKKVLMAAGHQISDCGATSFDKDDDYPDFVKKAAQSVSKNPDSRGIIFGGSGQGEAMVANRHDGVRAAVFYGPVKPKTSINIEGDKSRDAYAMVKLERDHNNANILSLGVRFISEKEALRAIDIFLNTPFSDQPRHQRRITKF
jgi:ribose 5-phosphate isomerase B